MADLAKVKKQLVGDDYIYDGCTVYYPTYHVLWSLLQLAFLSENRHMIQYDVKMIASNIKVLGRKIADGVLDNSVVIYYDKRT